MRPLTEILRINGQDLSLASKVGKFEQRPYGKIYIPPSELGEEIDSEDELTPISIRSHPDQVII